MALRKLDNTTIIFNIIAYTIVTFFAIFCVIPFLIILSGSFSSERSIIADGLRLIPNEFTLRAYELIFLSPQKILKAYGVSIMVTLAGSVLGLFIISMTGYVLYRRDFKYRNRISFLIYFTSLFSGGLIPVYILVVKYLQLKDSYLALILPAMLSAWYIILFRNFLKSMPDSIIESAKIDGAGDFAIYLKLVMPLSIPGLATIGLFLGLQYWNDWYQAMLYINDRSRFPLQFFLYEILRSAEYIAKVVNASGSVPMTDLPTESLKMATAVVVTGPIVFLYPLIQKYYVKGLTIGAVKG